MLGAVGDRVAVEFNKDEWYTGTITKVLAKRGYNVTFDDGESSTANPTVERVIKLDPKKAKKSKKALTLKDMRLLKPERGTAVPKAKVKAEPKAKPKAKAAPAVAPKAKAKPTTKVKPTKAVKKPVKKPAKPMPPMVNPRNPRSPKTPVNIRESNEMTAEEKHLMSKLSQAVTFSSSKSRPAKLSYLNVIWFHANKVFFDSKLPKISIRLSKDMGDSFRRRGAWFPTRGQIAISPRLFNGKEFQVLTTMVHEMCHQAVTQLDKISDRSNGGHGFAWEAWMRKCGLTPSRYSKYDNESFMEQHEKEEHKLMQLRKEKAALDTSAKQMRHSSLYPGESAQYFDAKLNKWMKGAIACKHDLAGKRMAFIRDPLSSSFGIIPSTWLYQVDEQERNTYQTDSWKNAVKRTAEYYDSKRNNRSARRNSRQNMRSIFGF